MDDLTLPNYYKSFHKGDVIFRQGDLGDCAYIIEEGSVDILLEKPDGTQQIITTRGQNAMIGEMSLVDHQKRTATVVAREDCKLLKITEEEFERRLNTTDPIISMAMKVILLRYRDTLSRVDNLGDSAAERTAEDMELETAHYPDVKKSIIMVSELKNALKNDELELYYQPINDVKSGRVLGFEALMRWNHPEKGLVPPNDFIPIAEESGLIVEMSKWALERSCADLAEIERSVGMTGLLYVSVNFTGKDLADANFTDFVYETLSKTDTDPKKIQIEITERMLMENPEQAQKTLDLFQKAGLRIAIDDFGTGYSSLSYLHHFPINCLKIDRSFVSKMLENKSSRRLVQSIINLAQNLDMCVTAEGIENEEELALLEDMGCEYGQGYFFSKPVSVKDTIETLHHKEMLPDEQRYVLKEDDEKRLKESSLLS